MDYTFPTIPQVLRAGSSLREVLRNRDNSGTEDVRWSDHVARFLASMQKEGPEAYSKGSRPLWVHESADQGSHRSLHGPEAWREAMANFFDAFPDAAYTLNDLFFSGDKGVWRGTWNATQRKHWEGIPATGRSAKGR